MSSLKRIVEKNEAWRSKCINLNAAESALINASISSLMQSDLARRAVLGTPGNRYSEGHRYIDELEAMLDRLLKELFSAKYAEWRPMSASVADGIVIHAVTSVGDKIIATPAPLGHPTWHEKGYAGFRGLHIGDIPMDWNALEVNYDKLQRLTSRTKFSLAIEGSSLILFPPDFDRLVSSLNNTPLWYDGAHVMGLIASGHFPNPLSSGAMILSGSTQKTLSGPLGGIILSNDKSTMSSIRVATSNDTATPDYGRIAGLTVTAIEWLRRGKSFASRIVRNAKLLATNLSEEGFTVLQEDRGFTETHQIAAQCPNGFSSASAARLLSSVNIVTTPFPIPDGKGGTRQILRLGTTEITSNGIRRDEIVQVARAIRLAFTDGPKALRVVESVAKSIRERQS